MSGQMMALVGAALVTAVLALVLKKDSPALAFAVGLAGTLYLLWGTLEPVRQLMAAARSLLGVLDGAQTIYVPVLKAVGIAVVVRLAGAVCQDAGQAALAAQLELAGTAAAIVVCLPLLTDVLSLVARMIA
nr:SpoIIIAC/SpoIIIAD family protein [uncultured Butyricicoccus sp.]